MDFYWNVSMETVMKNKNHANHDRAIFLDARHSVKYYIGKGYAAYTHGSTHLTDILTLGEECKQESHSA